MVRSATITAIALSIFAAQSAYAQRDYPAGPITLVVPNAPGGGMDSVGRILAQRLGAELGQSVVVENRPGGAENIGIAAVARGAAPDGYTLLLSSNSITINPWLFQNLRYDANKDLLPLGKVTALPLLIVTNPAQPFKSLKDMIAFAKANPNKLTYGSPGSGTPHHLAMELFKSAAGLDIQHIPYRGAAPGLNDLLGENISLLVTTIAPVEGNLGTGKVVPLATMAAKRLPRFAQLPAVSETLPGFEVGVWHGVFAPAATPAPIAAKITAALEKISADAELIAHLDRLGVIISWAPPDVLRDAIKTEQGQWAIAIQKAGIKPE